MKANAVTNKRSVEQRDAEAASGRRRTDKVICRGWSARSLPKRSIKKRSINFKLILLLENQRKPIKFDATS